MHRAAAWLASATGRDRTLALLVAVTAVALVWGVAEWTDRAHRFTDPRHWNLFAALRAVAVLLCAVALGVAWQRRGTLRSGRRDPCGGALLGFPHAVFLGWVAGTLVFDAVGGVKSHVGSVFWSTAIGFLALWTLRGLLRPHVLFSQRSRPLDALLWNGTLALILAEIAVSSWASLHPSPLLWDESSVQASLEARRLEPGEFYLGSRANRGGYHDEEFHPPRGSDDVVVAVLTDSFGVGTVNHANNFATVAEQAIGARLPGRSVAFHNYGVAGIGMPEYVWLLEHEIPAMSPQLVVLCVFVGNDIHKFNYRRAGYYAFQNFVVYEVFQRIIGASGKVEAGGILDVRHLAAEVPPPTPEPGKEVPTFDVESFLEVERERIQVTLARDEAIERIYERFFLFLESIHRNAGPRLRVVLIPDEFQVNDELWEQLVASAPEPAALERTLPQQRILAFCRERDLPCLDLLPALREAQRVLPVYHLRDTHWNARGNRVAGEAIAAFVERTLAVADAEPGAAGRGAPHGGVPNRP